MNTKLSRRKIAASVAERFARGEKLQDLLDEVAAYLVETRQTRSQQLMARAIEGALESHGDVIVSVASARTLTDQQRDMVAKVFQGKKVHIKDSVDPDLIGGLRVEAPGVRLDTTIKRKLTALKGAKI